MASSRSSNPRDLEVLKEIRSAQGIAAGDDDLRKLARYLAQSWTSWKFIDEALRAIVFSNAAQIDTELGKRAEVRKPRRKAARFVGN